MADRLTSHPEQTGSGGTELTCPVRSARRKARAQIRRAERLLDILTRSDVRDVEVQITTWRTSCRATLEQIFSDPSVASDFRAKTEIDGSKYAGRAETAEEARADYEEQLTSGIAFLENLTAELHLYRRRRNTDAGQTLSRFDVVRRTVGVLIAIAGLVFGALAFSGPRYIAGLIWRVVTRAPENVAVLPLTIQDDAARPLEASVRQAIEKSLATLRSQSGEGRPGVVAGSATATISSETSRADLVERLPAATCFLVGAIGTDREEVVLNVSLIDAFSGRQMFIREYRGGLPSMTRDLISDVVDALGAPMTDAERMLISAPAMISVKTAAEYATGLRLLDERTAGSLATAVHHFQNVVRDSPLFSGGYAGLASAYALLPVYSNRRPGDTYPSAVDNAQKALQLEPDSAAANAALGYVMANYCWNFRGAERHFRAAIEADPNYARAHMWYALLLSASGRHEEALAQAKTANKLAPYSPITATTVGTVHYFAGDYARAINAYERVLAVVPTFERARAELIRAHEANGDFAAALAAFQAWSPDSELARQVYGARLSALLGNSQNAQRQMNDIWDTTRSTFRNEYDLAAVYAALGNRDATLSLLNRACANRLSKVAYLGGDPVFRELRTDPAFNRLWTNVRENGACGSEDTLPEPCFRFP